MTGIALYAQYVMYLEPCPLCIFQRVAVMALGVIFLLGALHNPSSSFGRRGYGQLTIIAAVSGAAIAATTCLGYNIYRLRKYLHVALVYHIG